MFRIGSPAAAGHLDLSLPVQASVRRRPASGYWWLYPRQEDLYWAECDAKGGICRDGRAAGWEEIPAPADSRIVLCVEGVAVRCHLVKLPARRRRHFMAALPYALEDRLLQAPEDCHLVPLQVRRKRAGSAVMVVEHSRMEEWLQAIRSRQWRLSALFPDYLALPEPGRDSWLLDATKSPFLLRFSGPGGGAAFHGGPEYRFPAALLLALEASRDRPRTLDIYVSGPDQAGRVRAWEEELAVYGVALQIQEKESPREHRLAALSATDHPGSLLQDRYAVPSDTIGGWSPRQLLPSAALLAALMLTLLAQGLADHYRMQAEYDRLSQEIESTYRRVFPQARHLVDPRFQMEQQLQELYSRQVQRAENRTLQDWLEQLAPVFNADREHRLLAVHFNGHDLIIEVSLADFQTLEQLQSRLVRDVAGEVRIEQAELKDGRVFSRLRLGHTG